jgi:hypothetical protein
MRGDRGEVEREGTVADKSNLTDSPGRFESVERSVLTLPFLVRMLLFRFEPGFLRRAGRFGWLTLSWNYQRASDEIRQTLLGQITVATLTPQIARDHADASLGSESGRELVDQARALLVGERSGRWNAPEDLYARRCLVDVLTACTR